MTETQRRILNTLEAVGPLSHHGIIHAAKTWQFYTSPSGLRTRVSELRRAGLVRDSGMIERATGGRTAILWEAV
jgi:hypothetical protein